MSGRSKMCVKVICVHHNTSGASQIGDLLCLRLFVLRITFLAADDEHGNYRTRVYLLIRIYGDGVCHSRQ